MSRIKIQNSGNILLINSGNILLNPRFIVNNLCPSVFICGFLLLLTNFNIQFHIKIGRVFRMADIVIGIRPY